MHHTRYTVLLNHRSHSLPNSYELPSRAASLTVSKLAHLVIKLASPLLSVSPHFKQKPNIFHPYPSPRHNLPVPSYPFIPTLTIIPLLILSTLYQIRRRRPQNQRRRLDTARHCVAPRQVPRGRRRIEPRPRRALSARRRACLHAQHASRSRVRRADAQAGRKGHLEAAPRLVCRDGSRRVFELVGRERLVFTPTTSHSPTPGSLLPDGGESAG